LIMSVRFMVFFPMTDISSEVSQHFSRQHSKGRFS
jgi:hypothetical protein